MMTVARRSFLSSILSAGVAPALCRAGFLMPVKKVVSDAPLVWRVDSTRMARVILRHDGQLLVLSSVPGEGYITVTTDGVSAVARAALAAQGAKPG